MARIPMPLLALMGACFLALVCTFTFMLWPKDAPKAPPPTVVATHRSPPAKDAPKAPPPTVEERERPARKPVYVPKPRPAPEPEPEATPGRPSEAVRRQVYYELVVAEDKARREADSNPTRRQALAVLYKLAVIRRYDLPVEEVRRISIEGVANGWPMP